MTNKERLIELIDDFGDDVSLCDVCSRPREDCEGCTNEQLAEYLVENGVIVLHANVGAAIYYVELEINADKTAFEPKIHRTTVTDITIAYNYTMYSTSCGKAFPHSLFGELVFLTKAEALKALKGGAK